MIGQALLVTQPYSALALYDTLFLRALWQQLHVPVGFEREDQILQWFCIHDHKATIPVLQRNLPVCVR
jgi:hypothetical protein